MDLLLLIKAVVLGLVEGLTEFLPVSSTGHLIIVGDALHFNDEIGKAFEIVIQLGAILAICWEYRQRLVQVVGGITRETGAQRFIVNLFIAFLPVAVAGLMHESLRCPSVLKAIEQEMERLIAPLSEREGWPLKGSHEVRAILIWLLSDWLERRLLYQCSSCGFSAHELYWHCPGCRGWDSMRMRSDVFPVSGLDMKNTQSARDGVSLQSLTRR